MKLYNQIKLILEITFLELCQVSISQKVYLK